MKYAYIPEDVTQRLGLKRDPLGSHLVYLPGLRASQMRLQLRSNDHKSTESSFWVFGKGFSGERRVFKTPFNGANSKNDTVTKKRQNDSGKDSGNDSDITLII